MRLTLALLVAALLTAPACKKKDARPAPATGTSPAAAAAPKPVARQAPAPVPKPASMTAAKLAELDGDTKAIEDLSHELAAAGADCAKGAAAISARAKGLGASLASAKQIRGEATVDPTMRDWLAQNYGKRLMPVFVQLERSRKHCDGNAAFVAAYDALDLPHVQRVPNDHGAPGTPATPTKP